jgi:hypothetical protein
VKRGAEKFRFAWLLEEERMLGFQEGVGASQHFIFLIITIYIKLMIITTILTINYCDYRNKHRKRRA